MQKLDHNIGFCEKRQFVLQKLAKIAENCDHNIYPSLPNRELWSMYVKNETGQTLAFPEPYTQCKLRVGEKTSSRSNLFKNECLCRCKTTGWQ
jgi:hypothetical protein